MGTPTHAVEPVLLHAAGSLQCALTDVASAYEAAGGPKVCAKFGPSGILKNEIAAGERAAVFASANMEHPQALAAAGMSGPVVLFARNRICALARREVRVTPDTMLERMLDPEIKIGTSTPQADPSGDYAWKVFHKADALKPGAAAVLKRKALQLTGSPASARPPPGQGPYGWHVAEGHADLFLTYCTNALEAQKQNPDQQIIALPDALAVSADYGLTVLDGASPQAYRFAMYILSTDGRRILLTHGFGAPAR